MDDRTWYLAVAVLLLGLLGLVADAAAPNFEITAGFWAFLSAVLGFLGARAAIRSRNGPTEGGGPVENDEHLSDADFERRYGYRR